MKLVLVPHRGRASFEIADIGAFVCHYQSPLELACAAGIDPEIAGQFHRAADSFGNIAERAVAEDGGIERSVEIVPDGDYGSQIFSDEIGILADSLRERTEDDAFFGESLAKSGFH